MPKIKTHKGAHRRFHISASGKVLRTKGRKSHFRRRRSDSTKRLFGAKIGVSSAVARRVKSVMPHTG